MSVREPPIEKVTLELTIPQGVVTYMVKCNIFENARKHTQRFTPPTAYWFSPNDAHSIRYLSESVSLVAGIRRASRDARKMVSGHSGEVHSSWRAPENPDSHFFWWGRYVGQVSSVAQFSIMSRPTQVVSTYRC